jgi:hypothetical protein
MPHDDGGLNPRQGPAVGTGVTKDDRECPHFASCPMYSLFSYSGTAGVWKARYCTADYPQCARYQRTLEGRYVPTNLMPNGVLLQKRAVGA